MPGMKEAITNLFSSSNSERNPLENDFSNEPLQYQLIDKALFAKIKQIDETFDMGSTDGYGKVFWFKNGDIDIEITRDGKNLKVKYSREKERVSANEYMHPVNFSFLDDDNFEKEVEIFLNKVIVYAESIK